jgi:hypothetical protein
MENLGVDGSELRCIIKEQQHGKWHAVFIRFGRGTSSGISRARYLQHVISGFRRGDIET